MRLPDALVQRVSTCSNLHTNSRLHKQPLGRRLVQRDGSNNRRPCTEQLDGQMDGHDRWPVRRQQQCCPPTVQTCKCENNGPDCLKITRMEGAIGHRWRGQSGGNRGAIGHFGVQSAFFHVLTDPLKLWFLAPDRVQSPCAPQLLIILECRSDQNATTKSL